MIDLGIDLDHGYSTFSLRGGRVAYKDVPFIVQSTVLPVLFRAHYDHQTPRCLSSRALFAVHMQAY